MTPRLMSMTLPADSVNVLGRLSFLDDEPVHA